MIDPYKILGLPEDAPLDTIKKTYRDLSKKYHPDKTSGNKEFEEKFKLISEAYDMLNSEQKIKQYKTRGTNIHWDNDFEHMFKDFFTFRPQNPYQKAAHVTIHVNLNEIFHGNTKEFNYRVASTCKNCGGVGGVEFNSMGRVTRLCEVCHGKGSHQEVKATKVTIPRSVEDGVQIRAEDPSVIVTVKQMQDPVFQRNGFNILSENAVPLSKVFDGSEINVRTLHGELKVSIPKFTQNGSLLRIKHKGLFDNRQNAFGDHIIKTKILIPDSLTPEQCAKIVGILNEEKSK